MEERDGLTLLSTGRPSATWNVVHIGDPLPDPSALPAFLAEYFGVRGVPYTIRFREELAAALPSFRDLPGHQLRPALPAMVGRTGASKVGPPDAGPLVIRPVTAEADARLYTHLCALGFADPLVEEMTNPAIFDGERVHGFLGAAGGETVATGALVRSTGGMGIYDVTVASNARRQGHGAAMMQHLLSYAAGLGIPWITLQSGADGLNLHRRLGFDTVNSYMRYSVEQRRP